ncbi:MAG: hypothetical protein AB8G11_07110 [Saprospiraceae bacterium]
MNYKITYIFVIMLLPIIGESQIPIPNTREITSIILIESDSVIQNTISDSTNKTITKRFISKQTLLEQFWGNDLTALLRQAKKVNVFHVESLKTDDVKIPHIEQFSILNQATLDSLEATQFRELITDTSTYYLKEVSKQCLFMPRMVVQLIAKNDTINALISMKCDLIRFYYSDTSVTLNCDDGRIAILDYFSKAFPNVIFAQPEAEITFAAKSPKPIYHTVEAGESWFKIKKIAQEKVNKEITINDLYTWNNIPKAKRNKLKIGERVVIGFE